jgi:hypothetical protein
MQIIKCMVMRIIEHPGALTEEDIVEIKKSVKAPLAKSKNRAVQEDEKWNLNIDESKIVNDMPRNTIIALPVGPSQQVQNAGEMIICYPFFSSHLSLPVKRGELVWVFAEQDFDNETNLGDGPFFWMSRVHGSLINEDVSFTHYERQHEPLNLNFSEKDITQPEVITMMKDYGPSFSGNMFAESLRESVLQSVSEAAMEPVPRFTKAQGDFVIQGSHNTVISLGTTVNDHRDLTVKNDQKQGLDPEAGKPRSVYDTPDQYSGAIDIVVGRANTLSSLARLTDKDVSFAYGKNSEPITVLNDMGDYETKKNPTFLDTEKKEDIAHPRYFNMQEGDPDMLFDASRIYLTQNDDIDSTLGILPIMANSLYGDEQPAKMGSNDGGDPEPFESLVAYNAVHKIMIDEEGPAAAIKSKNVRIVASSIDDELRSVWLREDDQDPAEATEVKIPGEQGSIIILKEGKLKNQVLMTEPGIEASQISTGDETGPFNIEHSSEDGNGRAVIAMGADGTIYIDGPRIVIGSGNEKANGKGTQISLGLDAYEPIVMGKQLNATLQAFMEDVIKFITETFVNHEHATGAGPSGPAGTGTDIPATQEGVQTHGTDMQALVDSLNLHLSKIGKTK